MPNHVHVLVTPLVPVPRIMHSLKGFTARAANQVLDRTGLAFWQRESYDHWVREGEFERIKRYIEVNPVKAGLAREIGEYRWSG
jgi:putative transposase